MLTHRGIDLISNAVISTFPFLETTPTRGVSYLPLSHIAAQMSDIHVPMNIAAHGAESTRRAGDGLRSAPEERLGRVDAQG